MFYRKLKVKICIVVQYLICNIRLYAIFKKVVARKVCRIKITYDRYLYIAFPDSTSTQSRAKSKNTKNDQISINVSDPDPVSDWIRIQSGHWIRNPDPGGHKRPTKIEKSQEVFCYEVLDVLF
jgi:hypothetical protein